MTWMYRLFATAAGLSIAGGTMAAADEKPGANQQDIPHYEIRRARVPVTIDGKLDEPAWFAAPAVGPFHFPWYVDGVKEQTVAKLLWDDQYLYIAHLAKDAHITARHRKHDDPIAEDDCFEIMFAPDPADPNHYFNIEWNVHGGYIDGHRPAGAQGPRPDWEIDGLQIAGSYSGTLNQDQDIDRWWIAEVAIPFAGLSAWMPRTPRAAGATWRINLNRHGGDTNLQYSQWSPGDSPQPAFHQPHRFGVVTFLSEASP